MDHHKPETREFFAVLGKFLYKEAKAWRDARQGTSDWRKDPVKLANQLGLNPFANADEVETLFGRDPSERILLIQPARNQDNILPFLNVSFGKNKDGNSKTRLVLGMLVKKTSDGEYGFSGYRFESPEDSKNHYFHHIQPVTGIDKNDAISARCAVEWMPTRFPTFPIPAKDSIDLVLLSLMAFRGADFVKRLSAEPTLTKVQPARRIKELIGRIS
jgi:hypothetical protein